MKQIFYTLLVLFLFGGAFSFGQMSIFRVECLNAEQNIPLEQFKKLELGIQLPKEVGKKVKRFVEGDSGDPEMQLNPYLQWELDVEVLFTHAETGRTFQIPAFYYQEYQRDTFQNKYQLLGTNYFIRARFAPPLTGLWSYTVDLKVKNEFVERTTAQSVYISANDQMGNMRVADNKRNFQLGDNIVVPVGQNFPCPFRDIPLYNTIVIDGRPAFGPNQTHLLAKPRDWLTYLNDIDQFGKSGGKYIRTLQAAFTNLLEFEVKGDYTKRLHYAWEQDRLIELCESLGIHMSFNLLEQEPFMKYANFDLFDWDWSNYNRNGTYEKGGKYPSYCYADEDKKEPYEMFLDESDLAYHKQRTRYYMARYAYSTSIYQFELLSEPWHLGQIYLQPEPFFEDNELGALTRKAVANYENTMANFIRGELPFVKQLIGIDIPLDQMYRGPVAVDSAIFNPNIDVIGFNPYSSICNKFLISKSGENNQISKGENSLYATVNKIQNLTGKPLMVFEGGPVGSDSWNAAYKSLKVDLLSFGFCGLAGFNEWEGFGKDVKDVWPGLLQAAKRMNDPALLDIFKGTYSQGREKEYGKRDKTAILEMQYYISENGKLAAGYIRNRSYNAYTKRINDEVQAANVGSEGYLTLQDINYEDFGKLKVEGLVRGKYLEITYFDFKTGEILLTEKTKAKKNFRLKFPELSVTDGKAEQPILNFTIKIVNE